MRKALIIYGFGVSLLSILAFTAIASLSANMIEYWEFIEQPIPAALASAPLVCRISIGIPVSLFFATVLFTFRFRTFEKILLHAIGFTAMTLAIVTAYTICTSYLPGIVAIKSSFE